MKLIDAKAASRILGVRLPRLYELVRLRAVPHVRLGRRQIRFDPERLAEWSAKGGGASHSVSNGSEVQNGEQN
jgi:excisionase family DNA binding protein